MNSSVFLKSEMNKNLLSNAGENSEVKCFIWLHFAGRSVPVFFLRVGQASPVAQ